MRLNILSDANWQSRVDLVLNCLSSTSYRHFSPIKITATVFVVFRLY